jgi:hypothetical protein
VHPRRGHRGEDLVGADGLDRVGEAVPAGCDGGTVVGARSVRGMQLDVEGLVRRVGGRVLGSSRTPSVLVSFDEGPAGDAAAGAGAGAGAGSAEGAAAAARWHRFADAVEVVGADEILAAMTPPGVRRAS